MTIVVHREGVPSADDDPPRPKLFEAAEDVTLGELLPRIRQAQYLPPVPGGRATWIVEGERSLGLVMQEYREPWMLVGPGTRVVEIAGRLPRAHLTFRYRGQESPEDVLRELGGDPVRLSKEAWDASPDIPWQEALRRFLTPRRR